MKTPQLTFKRFLALLLRNLPSSMDQHGRETVVCSIKMSREATRHVGYSAKGYFSTEGTSLVAMFYDAPALFEEWNIGMQSALRPFNLYMERKNCCEFTIHAI